MGTFQGHALPGSFFIIFAIWGTIQIVRRLVVCKTKGIPFYNTVAYPYFCGCINAPVDGIVKVLITSIGMIAEAYAATEPYRSGRSGRMNDYHGVYVGDIQHISMYFMFFLSGIFDICANRKCVLIPPGMDYMVLTLAYATEGLLFHFHLHGRDPLDTTLHTLLVYTITCCVISCLVEYKYHNSVYAALSRSFFTFLQGTWFWQAGFVLYPPFPSLRHWDRMKHDNIMFATAVFTWHMIGVITAMSIIAGITYWMSTRVCAVRKGSKEYDWTGSHTTAKSKYRKLESSSSEEDEETVFNTEVLLHND